MALALVFLGPLATLPTLQEPTPAPHLDAFWRAADEAGRAEAARDVVAAEPPLEEVLAELRAGRPYAGDVPRGRSFLRHDVRGVSHPAVVLVPEDYDPATRYPVRLELHGGMGAPPWDPDEGAWDGGWTRARNQIVVFPAGWRDSMWWQASQVDHLERLLATVGRTWNVDEDRVVVSGTSDGGAAAWFLALRRPDRFAGYAGFVAPPDRLVRAEFEPDGQMHVGNLRGQRFFLTFGERDPLVPVKHLRRYLALFERHGAVLDTVILPRQRHELDLPDERMRGFIDFLWGTRRDPCPDEVTWSTEDPARFGRRHWVVVDELGSAPAPTGEDPELLPRWGTRIQLRGPTVERRPYGRIRATRRGNRFDVRTENVAAFRLLLADGEVDLDRPVTVSVDGEVRFEGKVEASLGTLLAWAGRDLDRRRLYVAELGLP